MNEAPIDQTEPDFKKKLKWFLTVVFFLVFAAEFIDVANLEEWGERQHKWSGVTHGIWYGSIAVLMVLSFIVLWRLVNKESKDTPSF